MEKYIKNEGSGIFVQLGAGAGDLDPRANYNDGFTNFIKKLPLESIKKLVLVEPNPINIPILKQCWKDYSIVEIHQMAITTSEHNETTAKFYFTDNDGPHYQIGSLLRTHNENSRYRGQKVNEINVNVETINSFLENRVGTDIELLAIDIEGMDIPVLLEIDFNKFKIKYLSFEHLGFKRQSEQKKIIFDHLQNNNFEFYGNGCDHNGYDYLFRNKFN